MSSKFHTATVRWFNNSRGLGFLATPTGDVFVHYSAIVSDDNYAILKAGQQVEFIPKQTDKGIQAQAVYVK